MGERFITLSDGKQKMLSTKTLSRKATSSSTKVFVTSVLYSLSVAACHIIKNITLSLVVMSFRIYHYNKRIFGSSHLQAKANDGRTFTSSWRGTMLSSSTLRARRERPNQKGWSTWACAPCTVCMTVCLAGEVSEYWAWSNSVTLASYFLKMKQHTVQSNLIYSLPFHLQATLFPDCCPAL